ncbi:anthrone oxygenase family protein [Kitasatospora sp. NPDC001527]|uniref:anthrone oxygenase family protein n=1 Tax=Kitasatospora sp. NPDC001527 TaxID=3154519 RepID=UPI00331D0126
MARPVMLLALVCTGLFAGFCFCYAFAVVRALARLDDRAYVVAMRHLNEAVPSPPFLVVLAGTALLPWAVLAGGFGDGGSRTWLLGAAALCAAGAIAVTLLGNVPMNARLAAGNPVTEADWHALRQGFEARWNALHAARTALVAAAFGLLAAGGLK